MFVLPKIPSFGERFADEVSSGMKKGLDIATQLGMERHKMNLRNKLISDIEGNQQSSPSQSITEQLQGSPSVSGRPPMEEDPFRKAKAYAAAGEHDLARIAAEEGKQKYKEQVKSKQLHEDKGRTQEAFDRAAEILNQGDLGFGSNYLSRVPTGKGAEVAEQTGEFDSLMGNLESMLIEMVNKGTLSNKRFEYITQELLPKSGDRSSKIRGKMKALAKTLGLKPSALLGESDKVDKTFRSQHVKMRTPDGEEVWVPKDDVKSAMSAGGVVFK